jgi:hypothetical protein
MPNGTQQNNDLLKRVASAHAQRLFARDAMWPLEI